MTKKHFIELADMIRRSGPVVPAPGGFHCGAYSDSVIKELANFCAAQNPDFKRDRWLDYIAGKGGKNGGNK